MALRNLTDKAKRVFEERGGTERAKQDGEALKRIAKGEGSLSDKAKAGMERLRKPAGDTGKTGPPGDPGAETADPPPPARTEPHPAPGSPSSSAEPPGAPPARS